MASNVSAKKKSPVKGIIKAVILLAVSIAVLWFVQRLLMPKYQIGVIEGNTTRR